MANVFALITHHKNQVRLWWPHRNFHFDSYQPNTAVRHQIKLNLSMIRQYEAYLTGQAPLPMPHSDMVECDIVGWQSYAISGAGLHRIFVREDNKWAS